jgi:hypothetical protein
MDVEQLEQPRERFESFPVHEARSERWVQGIGSTVSPAVVHKCATAEPPAEGGREVAPSADRAEPLMEEHDRGRASTASCRSQRGSGLSERTSRLPKGPAWP